MINTKELRIGNYVYTETIDEPYVIEQVYELSDTINYALPKYYNPLPLTEEWLLKFGFEKLVGWDDMEYFNSDGIHIYLCGNDEENWFEYENDVLIKSVHQLQNLYFALTVIELEYVG
jgi:hypothetical protein